MKGTISIPKNSNIVWMPKAVKQAGFTGKVECLFDAATIVLLHPNASLDDVERSLKLLLEDVQIRRRLQQGEPQNE